MVTAAGTDIMPALLIKISRREEAARNCAAASRTEEREARSRGMRWSVALGTAVVISEMAVLPLVVEREVI